MPPNPLQPKSPVGRFDCMKHYTSKLLPTGEKILFFLINFGVIIIQQMYFDCDQFCFQVWNNVSKDFWTDTILTNTVSFSSSFYCAVCFSVDIYIIFFFFSFCCQAIYSNNIKFSHQLCVCVCVCVCGNGWGGGLKAFQHALIHVFVYTIPWNR